MTERRAAYRSGSSEHQQQAAVVAWARSREIVRPALRLLFAVPNAGKRSVRLAAYMKAEGLKAGVPDLIMPYPSGEYCGLAIEMKWGDGEVSPQQREWLDLLSEAGWLAVVCWSAGEAIEVIETYLNFER